MASMMLRVAPKSRSGASHASKIALAAVPLHVEPEGPSAPGVVVQIDGKPVAGGGVGEMPRDVRACAEQALFLAAPERHADGAAGPGVHRRENAHRLHHRCDA